MAEKDILQNMIFQLGQSQDKRRPEELAVHFADVDERTPEDFLRFIKKLSSYINYYRTDISKPAGDWSTFFPYDETTLKQLLGSDSGSTAPHLALLLAFLELYKQPQAVINQITGRHFDFYFKEVLRLTKKAAVPDKAHVLLELKKNAAPISIGPANLFSAGKDATGVELIYAPSGDTVINRATVDSLRSVFLDSSNLHGTVRYAPIANSSDGVGGELTGDEPRWRGFGYEELPPAEVGFAIASPVLRMQEGARAVTVTLTLNNVDRAKLNNTTLNAAFEVFITGEKHWLGPYSISPTLSLDNILQFNLIMPESEKAVVDYDPAVHGYSYASQAPVLQVLLKANNLGLGYHDLKNVTVRQAQVKVEVSNIVSLALESDAGTLDPKKAFLPFGPQPTRGSRFFVGYAEALAKKLSELKVTIQWKDAPVNFASYYSRYGVYGVKNDYFTAAVSFQDGGNWEYTNRSVHLFESSNASSEHTMAFTAGMVSAAAPRLAGMKVNALQTAGSLWALKAARQYVLANPVLSPFRTSVPKPKSGVITFSLEKDFLQATYRQKYIESVVAISKAGSGSLPNEPYTPAIQSMSLSYKAHSDQVDIGSTSINDFSTNEVQFFHLSYFGQMREHGYQRAQFGFLTDKNVSLLPPYRSAGELLIGFKDLNPGESLSVLFQVAESSSDPDLEPEDLTWSVLCDNYWKPLRPNEVVLDTTNQLLTSGIIKFIIPAEATASNTILPANRLWIKGALAQNVNAVCQLIEVAANAVEVKFTDHGNVPSHLALPLKQGSISKLKTGVAEIKSMQQPFASFGGRPAETDEAFSTRVSERLRHKNRCITAWDYERVILEAFPQVHKVKCIPHAKAGSWLAPGNVLIVVVPDLKNKNAIDPLQPKVDADTLNRITAYVQKRIGMGVRIKVKNPTFQEVQLDFKVKLLTGYEFNFYSGELNRALIRFLSPWAYDASRDISFGGRLYKSVLLDFVEHLNYVDYVTEFKMFSYTGATRGLLDLNTVEPETPDAILVSAKSHTISQAE